MPWRQPARSSGTRVHWLEAIRVRAMPTPPPCRYVRLLHNPIATVFSRNLMDF